MKRQALLTMAIAATLATCMGQMSMGGAMEGMAGMGGLAGLMGGQGGLAGLMGGQGGMGGLASLLGGQGGMGGLGALLGGGGQGGLASMLSRMGNMGGYGGMVTSMLAPIMANAAMTSKMNQLTKSVLGPNADANAQLINYAKTQQQLPTNVGEMVPYFNMLTDLSKLTGILMPDGATKRPFTPGSKRYEGQPTMHEVRNLVIERGMLWFNSQQASQPIATNNLAPLMNAGSWY